ncbi:hypothetical protein [Caballeronia zhejiangensis]|uniref:Terminase n=1 Tax=Caballeronia zhejiangensis TaxID=871203 RepID=A0A656QFB1_9BURK|nr:hypothetical protein [Caballeronia zhejiangensis]KDR25952.1 terminase [Caballeronia zhejiangensis]
MNAVADNASLEDLRTKLADPMWRLCSGKLYKIITKGSDDPNDPGLVVPFKPNRAQQRLIKRLWHRNLILKARQLGFTTLIAIMWLDHALFNPNSRCGIIAQDRETAESLFRDKVKFAYDNLPDVLREAMPLTSCNKSEIVFAHNNSSMRVATSVRGGTIHRLHVSEFGKIAAKYPDKAKEVMTGSIPAVPINGILVIESTAEGREGEFFDLCQVAEKQQQAKKVLSKRDYRFHFFPWWGQDEYVMDPAGVPMTPRDIEYFEKIESQIGRTLTPEQRAWYVGTRNADFPNNEERMWQEYPSTPTEAFQKSTEGCYFTKQFVAARKAGRITKVPHVQGVPVDTFWDIGKSDGTAIWLMQRIGLQHRFIGFIEGWDETYSYFVRELDKLGYVYGTDYLPHDAGHERMAEDEDSAMTPAQSLERLGRKRVEVLQRIPEKQFSIQAARDIFNTCWFDEEACGLGLAHLESYRKEWNTRLATWSDTPRHDIHSEAADAFQQFAIKYEYSPPGQSGGWKRKKGNWRTA